MTKKKVQAKLSATSALGPIADALIQSYLGPDRKVLDMERFFTALMQALHDAYALGWKDRGEVEERCRHQRMDRLSQSQCGAALLAQPLAKPR